MRRLLIASFALSLIACGLGPKPSDDGPLDDTGDTDVSTGGASISDIQDGSIAEGETVTLKGVVVTSGWDGEGKGFFIQDAGGGEYSGIYVYAPSASDTYLEVGNELTITGSSVEYYDWTEFNVADTSAIEITGTAGVTVDSVDPAKVEDWEVWESCLIGVGGAEATTNVNGYGEIELDNGLVLDNWFYDYEGEKLATWTELQGLLLYNFETWKLAPRDADDLGGYTAGPGPTLGTVADTQDGTIATEDTVRLEGVVVTSPPVYNKDDEKNDGFHIQDAGGGSGVYVYAPGVSSDDVVVGAVLNIEATVIEFYELTELKDADLEWLGTTATVVPTTVDEPPADWEALEGHLVQLNGLEVTNTADYGEVETSFGPNIDDLFTDSPDVGTYASVTGIVTFSYGEFKILPRDQNDIVE